MTKKWNFQATFVPKTDLYDCKSLTVALFSKGATGSVPQKKTFLKNFALFTGWHLRWVW